MKNNWHDYTSIMIIILIEINVIILKSFLILAQLKLEDLHLSENIELKEEIEIEKPCFIPSGILAKETNTVKYIIYLNKI